jgi:hypothetical protein
MHDLTITTDTTTSSVPYNDFEDAHRALMCHAIGEDLYLQADWQKPRHVTTFKLLSLDADDRNPRITGTATIAPTNGKPVVAPYFSATDAMRWVTDHTSTWECSCDTDPGVRYPMAVLTTARAEARCWFAAGAVFPEAANMSDAGSSDVPRPTQHTFERLRDSARSTANAGATIATITPAQLAATVELQLTPDITPEQTAALIWYYALILWGVTAS